MINIYRWWLAYSSIPSTQLCNNNLVNSTYPISILSTQPYALICSQTLDFTPFDRIVDIVK